MNKRIILLLLFILIICGCGKKSNEEKLTLVGVEMNEKISKVKSAIVYDSNAEKQLKKITDKDIVATFVDMLTKATLIKNDSADEKSKYYVELYNKNEDMIDTIEIFDDNVGLKSSNKYRLRLNVDDFLKIIIDGKST